MGLVQSVFCACLAAMEATVMGERLAADGADWFVDGAELQWQSGEGHNL